MYKYSEANLTVVERFPALKPIYDADIEEYKDLPYIFFESVFEKYILENIHQQDTKELRRIFNFLEEFLVKCDEKTKNLIEVAVIESLFFEKDFETFNEFLFDYYGPLTKVSFEDYINGPY